jgi:NAD(P)-dependent dehydrogenase (short-subunit alcohol dehydrogenase family)
MNNSNWSTAHIPDLSGQTAIVTGANSGLGYETTKALAANGAHVVMACRSMDRASDAQSSIEQEVSDASLVTMELDLADLVSIENFATTFKTDYTQLNILVNNAGVMMPPFSTTEDGFELQVGVSYFGHFALTGHLIDVIRSTPDSRVVTLSSLAAHMGTIDFGNLEGEKSYARWREYAQSKLAGLMFARELQRRLDRVDEDTMSLAAHPGLSGTDLFRHLPVPMILQRLITQTPAQGALPILYAATSLEAEPGGYYGPGGLMEIYGAPAPAEIPTQAEETGTRGLLWQTAEERTDVHVLSENTTSNMDTSVDAKG